MDRFEIRYCLRPLHSSFFCHSGLDPESRKFLKTLDSGFRRNHKVVGFVWFCKGLCLFDILRFSLPFELTKIVRLKARVFLLITEWYNKRFKVPALEFKLHLNLGIEFSLYLVHVT